MIFEEKPYPLDARHWQRINMRSVHDLLGAEMIHNLYGRYWPQINSVRFRHTITNYKDGLVNSYAPVDEWRFLQKRVGYKFQSLNRIFLREIEKILEPDYALTREISDMVGRTDLRQLDRPALAGLLADMMDFPLGEIYRLNVVQIEYGLNYALHEVLKKHEPDSESRNLLLSKLIAPDALTVAQVEEVAFGELLASARKARCFQSSQPPAKTWLKAHHAQYAGVHCAYGELPPPLERYLRKFDEQIAGKEIVTLSAARKAVEAKRRQSRQQLARIGDERIKRLAELMARIGVFRDQNKAELGRTVPRRMAVLEEIRRRTKVDAEDLRFYLLSDIVALLLDGQFVESKKLVGRRRGVSFVRNDHLSLVPSTIKTARATRQKLHKGICAAKGYAKGAARIIHTKDDIDKMRPGDIMVAPGTDFDLLDIMHLASGIVTEEGGLLSHASVVSRELGKPCLIGVKDATLVIRDGDLVELQAEEGCLKILAQG